MTVIVLFDIYLGFECVILLAEVLLPVVMGVAPPVAPLKGLVRRDVDVLEVVVASIAAIRARSWNGEGTSWSLWTGEARHGHQAGTQCCLQPIKGLEACRKQLL